MIKTQADKEFWDTHFQNAWKELNILLLEVGNPTEKRQLTLLLENALHEVNEIDAF